MHTPLELYNIKPSDLPAPPQAALEMLRACAREDIDNKQLAAFAQTDPVLTAEVLRVVNTPLFGIAQEVSSVRHAISLLGLRALRNIVLCLMVREAVQQHAIPGFDITLFWEDTLRRAVAARWLGMRAGLDKDDCFSAGLLQDFGLLILFYLHPEVAAEFIQLRALDPAQRYTREKSLFGNTHDEVMLLLIRQWSLPPSLESAIGLHHQPRTEDAILSRVLYAADWINAVFCVPGMNSVLECVRTLLGDEFGLDADVIDPYFTQLPAEVTDTAAALGLHIQAQVDFEQLMRQANMRLARENTDYQELTWQLEKAIAERDRLAAELNREIAIAQEVQRHLMPDTQADDLPVMGLNLPARNISGDFFDYQLLRDGNICFAIGDVSGKGINAGLLMAKTASLFHCLAKHIPDPAKILAIINNEICETSVRGFFVTMTAGIYNPQTQVVRLVNAGHLPSLLLQRGQAPRWFEASEQPLGILPDCRFSLSEPIALRGGTLYLYSDGVTEAKTADGSVLECAGLATLLQRHQDKPPRQRLRTVIKAVQPQQQLHDDMTLLMINGELA
ncbi:MAG: HDOD domain-containing protein [Gammaproteobacteria bacterium]|nr:HDOD domain-containing protein [Gammaproteobacteria bacterium]